MPLACLLPLGCLVLLGCQCVGDITIVSGSTTARPGDVIEFAWHYDGRTISSPTRCAGSWTVNETEGGDDTLGRIDACGRYVAPAIIDTPRRITITGSTFGPACNDCCPYASAKVRLMP